MRSSVLATAVHRSTVCRSEIQPCIQFRPLAPIIEASQISFYDRFSGLESFVFHAGGLFFAEDFSSFDKLVFKTKKTARLTFSRGLTAWFFSSAEKKIRRTILEWSISPILTVLILGERTKCSADNFSGLDGFAFHFSGEFYRQSILTTKILKKNITTEINAGANKNYMSSLAAEGVRNGVLASALYRQTVCRSEFQPCIQFRPLATIIRRPKPYDRE